jgi:hypothetical protein
VRPHDDLRRAARPLEVPDESIERLGHVAVAQVPALDAPAEHRLVTALRVGYEAGVLLGVEVAVLVDRSVPGGLFTGHVPELDQLLDDGLLARLGAGDPGLVGVHLRVPAELLEAGVALARALRGLGVAARTKQLTR